VEHDWPIRLFSKSVIKQRKFKVLSDLLGPTGGLRCLDIGSDNGVMSYLLRQRGGEWKSADLDAQNVRTIEELVTSHAYQIDGRHTPFHDEEFDRVVIVDFLEHIPTDAEFIAEAFRILRPGGELIINVPHTKPGLLRKVRHAIGQTDAEHGHLRPGYTLEQIGSLLGDRFTLATHTTYSKFFSELTDVVITWAVSILKGAKKKRTAKGILVTGKDLREYQSMFRAYALIYPIVWLIARLDALLFFTSGYMLMAKARVNKESARSKVPPTAGVQAKPNLLSGRESG